MNIIRKLSIGLLAGASMIVLGVTAEAGQLVVLESTAPSYKGGTVLDGAKSISVPAGAKITVVSEDGVSRQIVGPYKGVPESKAAAGKSNGKLIAALSGLLKEREKSSSSLGTIRSGNKKSDSVNNPWHISTDASGDRCVPANKQVILYRQDDSHAVGLTIRAAGSRKDTSGNWKAGWKSLRLPERFSSEVKDGARYKVSLDEASVNLTFHVMPGNLTSPADQAAWMAEKHCRAQVIAMVRNNVE